MPVALACSWSSYLRPAWSVTKVWHQLYCGRVKRIPRQSHKLETLGSAPRTATNQVSFGLSYSNNQRRGMGEAATAYTDPPTGTMRQHARVTLYKETQKCGFDGVP